MASDRGAPRAHLLLLLAITLATVALGWIGLDYDLPHVSDNDEIVYLSQYRALSEHVPEPEKARRFVAYPSVWMHGAIHLPRFRPIAASSSPSLEHELAAASSDVWFLRKCVVWLSCLVVPATWLLARKFVESGWALVAAALSGTSVLGFCLATQARPHAVVYGLIALAVAASIDVVRRGTWRASLVAGLATGAAMAALQSGAGALLPLGAAHALRLRSDGPRALGRLALALVALAPIFLFAYPAVLSKLEAKPFAAGEGHGFLASHGVVLEDFHGGGTTAVFRAFAYHDPLLVAVALASAIGAAVGWLRGRRPVEGRRRELFVVLAFCLPYLAAVCLFERTFYRFALPLIPFAALFAVMGLRACGRAGRFGAAALALAQLGCIAQIVRLHVAGDTATQMAAWLRANLDRGTSRIAISPWLDLPLVRTQAALAAHGLPGTEEFAPWLDHQRALPGETLDALGWSIVDLPLRKAKQREALKADPAAFVRGLDADYLLIEVFRTNARPVMSLVREGARAQGRLIARFTPQGIDEPEPEQVDPYVHSEFFPYDVFVLQIWKASHLGGGLELYRIER